MIRHLCRKLSGLGTLATCAGVALTPSEALACGGFFCSQQQPVNQAAERIVFAQNDDGTVTAVIQIMYEGPSERFSWLLPIATVPDAETIAVSSDLAFQRLQNATNPQYNLTTRVEGTCRSDDPNDPRARSADSAGGGTLGGVNEDEDDGGVVVEASGIVGSFEWTVISIDDELEDPTSAAVVWLEQNDYDVTSQGAELIAPYLEDGMFLLALKLVKGADTGSIRPIVLTYEAGEPMIPIKLTAVAANDNMGVMAWLLADQRGVPKNYLSLELNEAQINWFNASSNYNDVVIAAAEEAGGHGFVTEFAGPSDTLSGTIWSSSDDQIWADTNARVYGSLAEIFDETFAQYGGYDGFWDAVRSSVTLPDSIAFEDFRLCPSCYDANVVDFSPTAYLAALEEHAIEPMRLMQRLFDERPYTTRLYTTMSAADMTLDPAFTFNADLEDVANVHSAERVIECRPEVYEWEAPWRIELPQGGVIRGTAGDAAAAAWPSAVQDQPANFTIRQLSASGQGRLVADNSDEVGAQLEEYNEQLGLPRSADRTDSGCSVGPRAAGQSLLFGFGALGLGMLGRRRRRRGA